MGKRENVGIFWRKKGGKEREEEGGREEPAGTLQLAAGYNQVGERRKGKERKEGGLELERKILHRVSAK